MINFRLEPYRGLFTLGLLSSLISVGLWIFFQFNWLDFYPRQVHANLMFTGFFWSFIAGFLMTAIPKMTQTQGAHWVEQRLAELMVVVQMLLAVTGSSEQQIWLFAAQNFLLLVFILRRFLSKPILPFEGFIFLPFAFIAAFFGVYSYLLGQGNYQLFYELAGQAFILNLICGIGSRLIPVLCRLPMAINPDVRVTTGIPHFQKTFVMAVWLNITFYLPLLGFETLAYILRAGFLLFYSITYLRLFVRPLTRTYVGYGIKFSLGLLILGYALIALFPLWNVPLLHLSYIGGFGLITIMVATRVTLAHGGESLDIELNSGPVVAVVFCLLLSATLRAGLLFKIDSPMLIISAISFILGLGFWWYRFARVLHPRSPGFPPRS